MLMSARRERGQRTLRLVLCRCFRLFFTKNATLRDGVLEERASIGEIQVRSLWRIVAMFFRAMQKPLSGQHAIEEYESQKPKRAKDIQAERVASRASSLKTSPSSTITNRFSKETRNSRKFQSRSVKFHRLLIFPQRKGTFGLFNSAFDCRRWVCIVLWCVWRGCRGRGFRFRCCIVSVTR